MKRSSGHGIFLVKRYVVRQMKPGLRALHPHVQIRLNPAPIIKGATAHDASLNISLLVELWITADPHATLGAGPTIPNSAAA